MPAQPLGEPVADELGFVRCVVVHDEMNVEVGRRCGSVESSSRVRGKLLRLLLVVPSHLKEPTLLRGTARLRRRNPARGGLAEVEGDAARTIGVKRRAS